MNENTKIIIYGGYSCGNFGDELILTGLVKQLKSIFGNPEIMIWPAQGRKKFIMHENAELNQLNIFKLCNRIKSADLVIIGGGGLIQEYSPTKSFIRVLNLVVNLIGKFNQNIIFYSLGAGPLTENSKLIIKETLSYGKYISTRDQASKLLLESCGLNRHIHIDDDPTYDINFGIIQQGKKTTLKRIGFAIRPIHTLQQNDKINNSEIRRMFIEAIRGLIKDSKIEVVLFPFQTGHEGDLTEAIQIKKALKEFNDSIRIVIPDKNYQSIVEEYGLCDLIVGMRLHSLILASCLNIPFIAINNHPKIAAFIKELAMEGYSLNPEEISVDSIKNRICEVLNNAPTIKHRLYQQLIIRQQNIIGRLEDTTIKFKEIAVSKKEANIPLGSLIAIKAFFVFLLLRIKFIFGEYIDVNKNSCYRG